MTAELTGTGGSLTIGSSRQKVKTKELPIGWKDLSEAYRKTNTQAWLGFKSSIFKFLLSLAITGVSNFIKRTTIETCVDHIQLAINKKYVPKQVFSFTIWKLKEWILLIFQGRCGRSELHPAVEISSKGLIYRCTKKLLVAPIQVKREVNILKVRPDLWGPNSRYPYRNVCRTTGSGRNIPC